MKVLIVDDEPLARMRLKSMLKQLQITDVLEAGDGEQGVQVTKQCLPDLVFLDIEMPVMSGLEAAQVIRKNHPTVPLIFSTAHDDFALNAFDLAATDYLLKPLSMTRLKQALEKVGLVDRGDKIQFKRGNDLVMVSVDEVISLVAEDKYLTVYLSDQTFILDQSLVEWEKQYPQFIRVHRSCLVHRDHIEGIHQVSGEPSRVKLKYIEFQPTISRRQLSLVKKILTDL